MSLGFSRAGFDILAMFDKNPRCVAACETNFPTVRAIEADLAEISAKEIRKLAGIGNRSIDVVIGGPPCGGFSIAGRRRSKDPRNELFVRFGDLIAGLRPSYFVAENVRGLLIGNSKKTLDRFRKIVETAGYEVIWPVSILNSADFGIPQKRERAIVIGALKEFALPSYPETLNDRAGREIVTVADAIKDLELLDQNATALHGDSYSGPLGEPSEYARLLRERGPSNHPKRGRPKTNALTGCLMVSHTEAVRIRFAATKPGKREPTSRCFRLDYEGYSPTLRAGTDLEHGKFTAVRPIHPVYARCITVREAARIHSYPDWFQFHPTKWHGFMQIGNSVPPLLAQAVAERIKQSIAAGSPGTRMLQ
jgi:DNA (cytosine-5)-methyltransferase 1